MESLTVRFVLQIFVSSEIKNNLRKNVTMIFFDIVYHKLSAGNKSYSV